MGFESCLIIIFAKLPVLYEGQDGNESNVNNGDHGKYYDSIYGENVSGRHPDACEIKRNEKSSETWRLKQM